MVLPHHIRDDNATKELLMQLDNSIGFTVGNITGSKSSSSAMSKEDAISQIQKLANDVSQWTSGALIKSNQERNQILEGVYAIYLAGKSSESIKNAVDDFASSQNITFKQGTGLATKLVRSIFQFDHKKSSSYATVLRVADTKNILGGKFAEFIAETGGLEAVRKFGRTPRKETIDKQAQATDYLITMDGVDLDLPGLDTQFTPTDEQKFFLLIVSRKDKDLASIKTAFTDKDAMATVLKKFYDAKKSEITSSATKAKGNERTKAIQKAAESVTEMA
jgi:hypothetical protein